MIQVQEKVCEYCEGTGEYYQADGPDDFTVVTCQMCRFDPEPRDSDG